MRINIIGWCSELFSNTQKCFQHFFNNVDIFSFVLLLKIATFDSTNERENGNIEAHIIFAKI
mgnify:FL=1